MTDQATATMLPAKIIHLLSGGLDSVTLLYKLCAEGERVHCLLADYRQRNVQELEWAKFHCIKLGVLFSRLDLPELSYTRPGSVEIPNRNAILISIAASIAIRAKAEMVTIGVNLHDADLFWDCRPEFIRLMNDTIKPSGIEVCAPFIYSTKREIAAKAKELGVDLWSTWSCYEGGTFPCGRCAACKQRTEATA